MLPRAVCAGLSDGCLIVLLLVLHPGWRVEESRRGRRPTHRARIPRGPWWRRGHDDVDLRVKRVVGLGGGVLLRLHQGVQLNRGRAGLAGALFRAARLRLLRGAQSALQVVGNARCRPLQFWNLDHGTSCGRGRLLIPPLRQPHRRRARRRPRRREHTRRKFERAVARGELALDESVGGGGSRRPLAAEQ